MKECFYDYICRGKCVDNGRWVYGYYVFRRKRNGCFGQTITELDRDAHYIITVRGESYEVVSSTVSPYARLKDKSEKWIFDGDICRFREWDNGEMCWVGRVNFEHCQYVISGGANKECPTDFHIPLSRISSESIEVIGNIHDNPTLLDVKE